MNNKQRVCIGLGSNLGDRLNYLIEAVTKIKSHPNNTFISSSSIYETPSLGFKSYDFYNCVIIIDTSLTPERLLQLLQKIESLLGKKIKDERNANYMARTIDLDILLFGNTCTSNKTLTIPHPETFNRTFVTKPLLELNIFLNSEWQKKLETKQKKATKDLITLCKKETQLFLKKTKG